LRSTSCREIAQDILQRCVDGAPPKFLPRTLTEETCAPALFSVLVEGLADRFEPSLCDAYARLFSQAIAHVTGADAATLVSRYERVRRPRKLKGNPKRVFVLSRITLGADVAVTSVILAAVKQRFRRAKIALAGPTKNYELFAEDPRIHHARIDYPRGSLRERLAAAEELSALVAEPDCVVIDPDSRLTQLGLLPVCPDERYHLFESRAYSGTGLPACPSSPDKSLPELTSEWAAETLGISGAKPYIAVAADKAAAPIPAPYIAVSLGVGENAAKRIADPFEEQLLALLAKTGLPICIDKGAGGAEAERVQRAVERSGVAITFCWEGSFAGFASIIAASKLYVGYDSAGQHIAAACGVPLISVFAGFPAPCMFERWRPVGPNCQVIRVDQPDPAETIERVREALRSHKFSGIVG
jgi:ADP-heptose:LPS heptosyltransferase